MFAFSPDLTRRWRQDKQSTKNVSSWAVATFIPWFLVNFVKFCDIKRFYIVELHRKKERSVKMKYFESDKLEEHTHKIKVILVKMRKTQRNQKI